MKDPQKTADEATSSKPSAQVQSVEPAQPITVDALLGKLVAKLPKAEADKLKKFITRLERERVANRDRQKAFRDRKRQEKT